MNLRRRSSGLWMAFMILDSWFSMRSRTSSVEIFSSACLLVKSVFHAFRFLAWISLSTPMTRCWVCDEVDAVSDHVPRNALKRLGWTLCTESMQESKSSRTYIVGDVNGST